MTNSTAAPTSSGGGRFWPITGLVLTYIGSNLIFVLCALISFERMWGEGGDPTLTQRIAFVAIFTFGLFVGLPLLLVYNTVHAKLEEKCHADSMLSASLGCGVTLLFAFLVALVGAFISF